MSGRTVLIAGGGLVALAALGAVLAQQEGRSGASGRSEEAAAASAQSRAALREVAALRARVDELELRVRVMEARSGYQALDGTRLPAIEDPLAPNGTARR